MNPKWKRFMGENTFLILKLVGGILGGFVFFKFVTFLGDHQEKRYRQEKDEAEKDYREALNFYMEHRSDLEAKERCYRKGDVYFSFKFPDTFQYPMLDFDYNSEFIDNRSLREKMVEEEIKEEFKRNRSA
tara:strand:- start:1008 stop:1397 length:390 start_codon:yes stop_codon:yes gene_type:complete